MTESQKQSSQFIESLKRAGILIGMGLMVAAFGIATQWK